MPSGDAQNHRQSIIDDGRFLSGGRSKNTHTGRQKATNA